MARFLPLNYSSVLDIGCGEGEFSRHLKKNCDVWGVEPDAESAVASSRKYKKVLVGKYEEMVSQIPDGYFDLVICNDVIEQMADHEWFFRSIHGKVKGGGCLIGSIPNVRYIRNLFDLLLRKDWQYQDSGILDKGHLRFFTKKSFLRIFSKGDFIVEKFEGINPPTQPFKRFYLALISAITLGHASDIRYFQFGFRVVKSGSRP